jgi:ATP-dependent Clp protease ATP-binding subunit ClpC
MSTPISIKMIDLISAARSGRLSDVVERDAEMSRLVRLFLRPTHHHAVLVAEPGTGKSSLIDALALRLSLGHYRPLEPKIYRLSTEPLASLMVQGDSLQPCITALTEAASKLGPSIIAIEDIQLLAADDPGRLELTLSLLQSLAALPHIRLVTSTTESAYRRVFSDDYLFNRLFYALTLTPPDTTSATRMVEQATPALERLNHQRIETAAIEEAVRFGHRFGHGRALPDAAIRLLEETCVKASLDGQDIVTPQDIKFVVSERERLPLADLDTDLKDQLVDLEPRLQQSVVGQTPAIRTIARHLAKAQIGLTAPNRPRGSFLLLGPSGVGKTETARALAKIIYSGSGALIRLDMSEYSEPHSAIRLTGSPPGYIGYEEGGQLTGAVMREPYSLVLLDEIEKAHAKLFDLFLQILDDGRLTDSQGRTVDFTETMIMATSNTGSYEISEAAAAGIDVSSPQFVQKTLLPILLQTYRPEFINRFDAILVYQPLSESHLVALAQRELTELTGRLSSVGITFNVADTVLLDMMRPDLNPLFGARPVKRLVVNRFETPLADLLIRRRITGPVVITGTESWLQQEVQV